MRGNQNGPLENIEHKNNNERTEEQKWYKTCKK